MDERVLVTSIILLQLFAWELVAPQYQYGYYGHYPGNPVYQYYRVPMPYFRSVYPSVPHFTPVFPAARAYPNLQYDYSALAQETPSLGPTFFAAEDPSVSDFPSLRSGFDDPFSDRKNLTRRVFPSDSTDLDGNFPSFRSGSFASLWRSSDTGENNFFSSHGRSMVSLGDNGSKHVSVSSGGGSASAFSSDGSASAVAL